METNTRIKGSRHVFNYKKHICCNFQACSASDLQHMITTSAYGRRSAGPLLPLPPPRHSAGSWDISGDMEGESQSRNSPRPTCCHPKGERSGAWRRPRGRQASPWGTGQHSGPGRPEVTCAQGQSRLPKKPQPHALTDLNTGERKRLNTSRDPDTQNMTAQTVWSTARKSGKRKRSPQGEKKSTWVKWHHKRQILCLKTFLP